MYAIKTSSDFSIPGHTKALWQKISSRWSHRDRPVGQRFLGNACLEREDTEIVLDIVGDNLKKLSIITPVSLYERFDEPEQNWLKILTFALSEYAYYYSDLAKGKGFWLGFCQQLKLPYNQGKEKTLRQVADKGFDLLGLVKAKGGYSCVSTLWLQSGIPQQNLDHFTQLVQEVSDKYGWWELAHASCEDIAQELLNFCQEKHCQWKTLMHFLESSCLQQEKNEIDPISGQLVQGIATVAQELEGQKLSPEDLISENKREELLKNYYLPQNFFLRDWETLIRVLTRKARPNRNSRGIVSRRKKPLSLALDVADSLNIQLVLPEQSLCKKEWERLEGTFCKIPEASWESTISKSGGLMIPEQVVDVRSVDELRTWQLLNHQDNSLIEWKLEGVASDFPCLIFDAWSGDRLTLDPANPTIRGTEEIICFTPKGVNLKFDNGIEILDSYVPSSIRGWQGQQLALTTEESSIVFSSSDTTTHQLIWGLSPEEAPSLRGLKLKGKKLTYLEIPTFWYPPLDQETSLNISIDSFTDQKNIANTNVLHKSNNWLAIPLNRWITESGKYEARFWNQEHRWSYCFEIQLNYQIQGKPDISDFKIYIYQQVLIENLPIKYDASEKFWAAEVQMEGLWPLEVIHFSLSDKQDKVFYLGQADSLGNLHMSLAVLHDLLPNSDWYALDYQQLGREPQPLIEMETDTLSISWTWTNQEIHLSGLSSEQLYSLSCWNLLLPQSQPVEIKITLSPDEQTIPVLLELPPGIYHIQLFRGRKLHRNLGWWCGSHQYDLPDEAQKDESLENYCYTILGDEPVKDFLAAANEFDYDCDRLKTVFESMHNLPCYFPKWLSSASLKTKIKALLQDLNNRVCLPKSPIQNETSKLADKQLSKEYKTTWILITLTHPKKRELVCQQIQAKKQIEYLIIKISKKYEQSVYEDWLLLEVTDFKSARDYLQNIHYVNKIQQIKPKDANRMLGL